MTIVWDAFEAFEVASPEKVSIFLPHSVTALSLSALHGVLVPENKGTAYCQCDKLNDIYFIILMVVIQKEL